jgi:hypothetical protein
MKAPNSKWDKLNRKYHLYDWWKSVIFLGVLGLIELYVALTPGAHR